MTFISSAITSTATRAAMMAMPIVDITNEKLSSISKMDLNRKVKTLFDALHFRRLKIYHYYDRNKSSDSYLDKVIFNLLK